MNVTISCTGQISAVIFCAWIRTKAAIANLPGEHSVMKMRRRLNFVYLAGMIPVVLLLGMLLFLVLENLLSGRAVYGDKLGNSYEVIGFAAFLVNVGILGLVGWLVTYIAFLISRSPKLMQVHRVVGAVSGLLITAGLLYGAS